MKPFSITEGAKKLVGTYPPAQVVREALEALNLEEKSGLLRLWVSEGIPFAFREAPMLYEAMREWFARRLAIHPKTVTIIGSGRIGYSLSPLPKFGRDFNPNSDLDLAVIESEVFKKLSGDFQLWMSDMEAGTLKPRNDREAIFWPENLNNLPRNISRGFIDPYKIPPLFRYRTVQRILDAQSSLTRKIQYTPGAPAFRGLSVRVYRDWHAFLGLMEFNLHSSLRSFVAAKLSRPL